MVVCWLSCPGLLLVVDRLDEPQTRSRVEAIVKHAIESALPTAMIDGAPTLRKALQLDCDFVPSWGSAEAHGGAAVVPPATLAGSGA